MILDGSNCDELSQVMGCVLRDKNIGKFTSNPQVNFEDLNSIEFLNLSHNLLVDCLGLSPLVSL